MEKKTVALYLWLIFATRSSMGFIGATYVLFLMSHGLDLLEVNLVNFAFYITLFLCEIPTGAIADVFGRKFSFVMSCVFYTVGMLIYFASDDFWGFVTAECISAIGCTFASGAFQSWFVDKMRHHGFKGSLSKVFAKENIVTQLGIILSSLLGAYLGSIDLSLPWLAAGIVMALSGIVSYICMREEYFEKQKLSWRIGWQSIKDTVRSSFHYGKSNKAVRFILVIGSVQFFANQAPNMQWQPIFVKHLQSASLGWVYMGISISLALGAIVAPWCLEKIQSEKRSLVIIQVLIGIGVIGTILMREFWLILLSFLFHEFGRGVFEPLKDVYLQDNIPSKERATIISFEAISHHVGGAIGLLLFGIISLRLSMQYSWIFAGLVLVFSGVWFLKNGGSAKAKSGA